MALDVDPDREFTIAIFPDTQFYCENNNGIFESMADWVVDNKDTYNIKTHIHVGDLVQSYDDSSAEWDIAEDAIGRIDTAPIPSMIVPGNHDADDLRQYATYRNRFPTTRYSSIDDRNDDIVDFGTYEGHPENSYFIQEIFDHEFLFIGTEFGPRDEVVEWVGDLLADNRDKIGILVTHVYLFPDGELVVDSHDGSPEWYNDGSRPHITSDNNNGVDMWNELSTHPNLAFVSCGHFSQDEYKYNVLRMEDNAGNEPVPQLLHNYQFYTNNGGDGWFRLVKVDMVDMSITSDVYSPYVGSWGVDDGHEDTLMEFDLRYHWLDGYAQGARWATDQTVTAADGGEWSSTDDWSAYEYAGGAEISDGRMRVQNQ